MEKSHARFQGKSKYGAGGPTKGQWPREEEKVSHYDHSLRAFEARWRILFIFDYVDQFLIKD